MNGLNKCNTRTRAVAQMPPPPRLHKPNATIVYYFKKL